MQHYNIGDVHGYYNPPMRLVTKLPEDAKLVLKIQNGTPRRTPINI